MRACSVQVGTYSGVLLLVVLDDLDALVVAAGGAYAVGQLKGAALGAAAHSGSRQLPHIAASFVLSCFRKLSLRYCHFIFLLHDCIHFKNSVFQQTAQRLHAGVSRCFAAAAVPFVQVPAACRAQALAVLRTQKALGQLRQKIVGSERIQLDDPVLCHQKSLIVLPADGADDGMRNGAGRGQLQRSQAAVAQHRKGKPVGAIECNYTGTVLRLCGNGHGRRKQGPSCMPY